MYVYIDIWTYLIPVIIWTHLICCNFNGWGIYALCMNVYTDTLMIYMDKHMSHIENL